MVKYVMIFASLKDVSLKKFFKVEICNKTQVMVV